MSFPFASWFSRPSGNNTHVEGLCYTVAPENDTAFLCPGHIPLFRETSVGWKWYVIVGTKGTEVIKNPDHVETNNSFYIIKYDDAVYLD